MILAKSLCLMTLTVWLSFSLDPSAYCSRFSDSSGGSSHNVSSTHNSSSSFVEKQRTPVLQKRTEKTGQIAKILDVVQKLSQLARSNTDRTDADPDKRTRQKIYNEVQAIKKPDQLVILGRICRSILADQEAGDAAYDKIFNAAFWHCVSLLSEDTSDNAVRALSQLWVYSN